MSILGNLADKALLEILGVELPDDAPLNERQFTFAMAQHMERAGATRTEATRLAHPALLEYLAVIGRPFGAPGYAWDRGGARDVADEMSISLWGTT